MQDVKNTEYYLPHPESLPVERKDVMRTVGNGALETVAAEEQKLDSAVDNLERRGYAYDIPRLVDQAEQSDRTNIITYGAYETTSLKTAVTESPIYHRVELTEQQALKGLQQFLEGAARDEILSAESREVARDMLDNLAVVGAKEIAQIAELFAADWLAYLKGNNEHQICVLTRISGSDEIKSDKFMFEKILQALPYDTFEKVAQRIVTDPHHITAPPSKVRIILVDDWTISETQLRTEYREVAAELPPEYVSRMEVQLGVATDKQLAQGIENPWDVHPPEEGEQATSVMPIRACFRAKTPRTRRVMATGSHSASDLCFESEIARIVEDGRATGRQFVMPPLTNIVRTYQHMSLRYTKQLIH